jgi:aspartate/methionine/tyrosine aminotransferase
VFAPREEVLALADLAARRGAVLLINEVYRGYSDRPSYHGAADNIVIVSSLSKLVGAYVLRLGWLSARPALEERIRRGTLNMGPASMPSAAAGLALMARLNDLRRDAAERARRGCGVVDAWVRSRPDLSWHTPQGPGYGCVALPAGTDDIRLAERLDDEHHVLLVPGTLFEVPSSLRLSWLGCEDQLEEGLRHLGEGLDRLLST